MGIRIWAQTERKSSHIWPLNKMSSLYFYLAVTFNVWYCNSRAYPLMYKAESSKYTPVSGEANALGLSSLLSPSLSGLCDCQFHTSLRWRSLASPILFYFCRRTLYPGKGVKSKRDSFLTCIEVRYALCGCFNAKFVNGWSYCLTN